MIPYLLAITGGYLIGNNSESKKYKLGGKVEENSSYNLDKGWTLNVLGKDVVVQKHDWSTKEFIDTYYYVSLSYNDLVFPTYKIFDWYLINYLKDTSFGFIGGTIPIKEQEIFVDAKFRLPNGITIDIINDEEDGYVDIILKLYDKIDYNSKILSCNYKFTKQELLGFLNSNSAFSFTNNMTLEELITKEQFYELVQEMADECPLTIINTDKIRIGNKTYYEATAEGEITYKSFHMNNKDIKSDGDKGWDISITLKAEVKNDSGKFRITDCSLETKYFEEYLDIDDKSLLNSLYESFDY